MSLHQLRLLRQKTKKLFTWKKKKKNRNENGEKAISVAIAESMSIRRTQNKKKYETFVLPNRFHLLLFFFVFVLFFVALPFTER